MAVDDVRRVRRARRPCPPRSRGARRGQGGQRRHDRRTTASSGPWRPTRPGARAAFVPMYEAQHPKGVGVHRPRLRGQAPLRGERRHPRAAKGCSRRFRRSSTWSSSTAQLVPTEGGRVDLAGVLVRGGGDATPSRPRPTDERRPHLHERHHRQPQGRHPHPRQHRVERERAARDVLPSSARDLSLSFLALGALVRADRASCTPSSRSALRIGALRVGRQDHRQPGRGAADDALQRPAHLQQAAYRR